MVRSCTCNALNAFCKRHGKHQPPFTGRFDEDAIKRVAAAVSLEYTPALKEYYDSWMDKWPAGKQVAIKRSIEFDPVSYGKVTSFIKREVAHEPPSRARLIQGSPNLATQARMGPEHRCFQKALCSVFNLDGYELFPDIFVTVGSGFRASQLADWLSNKWDSGYRIWERDGKSWDSCMRKQHHDLKISVMRECSAEMAASVDSAFKVTGLVRRRDKGTPFRYILDGTVKSGHNDTTSGNSLINAFISAQAMRDCGLKGHVIVAGDDLCSIITSDFDENLMCEAEKVYGITPKGRKFTEPTSATFISACWIATSPGRYSFVPLLGRLLCRLWWTTKPPLAKHYSSYMHGIVCGLKPSVGNLPMYKEYLEAHDFAGVKPMTVDKFRHSEYDEQSSDYEFALEALSKRYSLTPTQIRSFCGFLTSQKCEPVFVRHPVADVIINCDTADIEDRPMP